MAITLVPATPAKAEFTASYHKRIASASFRCGFPCWLRRASGRGRKIGVILEP